jgi:branched-chain amino acid aminotransferase
MNGGPQIIWLKGRFLPSGEAAISPLDRGFLYGDGVFETMRAEKGSLLYLKEHLERLFHSLSVLRIPIAPSLSWRTVLEELLTLNQLTDDIASVKIIVSRGAHPTLGTPEPVLPTICLTAQRYIPPSETAYQKGWKLHIFKDGYSPPTAMHKSLNYLCFLLARQAAYDVGTDEAVIADPQGRVSETSAGSLLIRKDGKWMRPVSPYQLPGITIKEVVKLLKNSGMEVEERELTPDDLLSSETIWVLNSLMGIMPVSHVSSLPIPHPSAEEAARLRALLFDQDRTT